MSHKQKGKKRMDQPPLKGTEQRNRWYGRIIVAQRTGQTITDPLPSFADISVGSPNMKMSCVAVLLKARARNRLLAEKVAREAVRFLEYQIRHGHQKLARANEFNGDSHDPHWVRSMGGVHEAAVETAALYGGDGIFGQLLVLTRQWWARHFWLYEACAVPPDAPSRANQVVALGARFAVGQRMERDVCYGLIRGVPTSALAGKRFWQNARVSQDTFGMLLLYELMEQGALDRHARERPTSAGNYLIERFVGGHVTSGDGLQGKDPAVCWVRYSDGKMGTSLPVPGDLGELVSSELLEAAPSPEAVK
jgi:hypothetical protein